MKYQLVLQWPGASLGDYDAMVAVEDLLIDGIGEDAEVDGHDAGSGEVNIFIRTGDPNGTFQVIKDILSQHDFWKDIRVAYREVTGSVYTVIWPNGLTSFRVG